MISVVNIRKKMTENNNLARLLKDVNNKLTVFKVTETDHDIVESAMLDNKFLLIQYMSTKLLLL